jgi:hypothetical protein
VCLESYRVKNAFVGPGQSRHAPQIRFSNVSSTMTHAVTVEGYRQLLAAMSLSGCLLVGAEDVLD